VVLAKDGVSWADRVRNKKWLQRVKKERNILKTIKRKKDNHFYWPTNALNCIKLKG